MDTLQGESRVQKPWTKEVKMFKIKSNLTWVGEKWQSLFVFWVKKGPQKMFWIRKSKASSYILRTYLFIVFCSLAIVFVATSLKIQYGLWSFQTGVTKLERFLHKNQHTQTKLLNFEKVNGEVSKIEHHFENKVI